MNNRARVSARTAGLLLVVVGSGCHLVFGDFEAVESENTGGIGGTCTENTFRCQGAALEKCTAGSWVTEDTCSQPANCQSAKGRCHECEAGEHRCDGALLQKCNDAEDGWVDERTCPAEFVCNDIAGDCTVCKTGNAVCTDDLTALKICNTSSWSTDTCDQGCVDEPGDCDYCSGCSDREEGTWRCTDCGKVQHCQSGTWQVTDDCGDPRLCTTKANSGSCLF